MDHNQLVQRRIQLLARKAQLRDELDGLQAELIPLEATINVLNALAAQAKEPAPIPTPEN